jgi:hypothetical protein
MDFGRKLNGIISVSATVRPIDSDSTKDILSGWDSKTMPDYQFFEGQCTKNMVLFFLFFTLYPSSTFCQSVTFCNGLNWPFPDDYFKCSLKAIVITFLRNVRPDFFTNGSIENFTFSLIVSAKVIIFSGGNE